MRITFVLPAPIRIPMGGAQVVYAHAAGLVERGHAVTVVMPRRTTSGPAAHLREAAVWLRDRWHGVAGQTYYEVEGVRSLIVPAVTAAAVPDADAVIATGVQTVHAVQALPPEKGRPFYFIQGLETFVTPDAPDTWHCPMQRITCAQWLRDVIEAEGAPVLGVVPNAIDPASFYLDRPIREREPRVLALYHRHPVKGPDVLIDALETIKRARPDVVGDVFAARPPSHRLPAWVRVHVRPTASVLRRLYNDAAVLLHSSRSEAWPLVGMEAAACGCAVAASANPGIQEYLDDGVSMRMAPIGDGRALGAEALVLLDDTDLRVRQAEAALDAVSAYRWPDLTARFEALLVEGLANH